MLLISACLLGCACRYDGKSKPHPLAVELARRGLAVPVCPEQLGGLPTPRKPSERQGGRVVMADGRDVTAEYRAGAERALGACPGTRLHPGSAEGAQSLLRQGADL